MNPEDKDLQRWVREARQPDRDHAPRFDTMIEAESPRQPVRWAAGFALAAVILALAVWTLPDEAPTEPQPDIAVIEQPIEEPIMELAAADIGDWGAESPTSFLLPEDLDDEDPTDFLNSDEYEEL